MYLQNTERLYEYNSMLPPHTTVWTHRDTFKSYIEFKTIIAHAEFSQYTLLLLWQQHHTT